MSKAYDNYDYPSYWKGREYEHAAEIIAIKSFLSKVPRAKSILEIGSGFGRITPTYISITDKIILTEPSSRLIKLAKNRTKSPKVSFIQSSLESLPKKIKNESSDLIIMIRVLHHLKDPDEAFSIISKLTKKNGHLILEFANKQHLKATFLEFLKGNFTFPLDIFPKDLSKNRSKKKKALPFKNYHPDSISECLEKAGFKVIRTRSVSNFRNSQLKKLFPTNSLLSFERLLQVPLSKINFGPSIFVLAKKVK